MNLDHVAPGQSLGFLYQFDRATFVLLSSNTSVIEVGIEDIDDVSIIYKNGNQVREQDKSVTDDYNPLTNKSIALWKTLHIWIIDILSDPNIIEKTEYHLVTNGKITEKCLAAKIHNAKTYEQAKDVSDEIRQAAQNLREDLLEYGLTVLTLPVELLTQLILKTYVYDKMCSSFGGNIEDIQSLYFFPSAIKSHIFDLASGWFKRRIREAVQSGNRPKILKADFDREIRTIIRKFQVAPLLALLQPQVTETDIENYKSCGFVQQLDWIDCDELLIRDAVIHYIYARNARINWTDSDLVSDTSLLDYENDLITRWGLVYRRVTRNSKESPIEIGMKCLDETLKEDTSIDNQIMPKQFTCGSFHALADFDDNSLPKIGWHPDYQVIATRRGVI